MTAITPGMEIPPFEVAEVRLDDIETVMHVMGDFNPVHNDLDLVERLGLRGPVNQGPANAAYLVNMILRWMPEPGSLRSIRYRFHDISCPGDRLVATGTVESVEDGLATCSVALTRSTGETVVTGTVVVQT
jgi:acyl dehydratase